MEELENKTFLIKVRRELFEYLKSENKHEKVGKLKLFLNKKRNKPELIFEFNKKEEPKTFFLSYNKTNDFIYFGDKETKEGFKIGNVDNFGNLIINKEEIADELIKDAYNLEKNKNEIKVREVTDGEKRYVQHEEIKLSGNQFISKDKKEKRVRIENEKLIAFIKEEVKKNSYITTSQISDKYNVPEAQVKELMDKICDKVVGANKKYSYTLKTDFEE